MHIVILDAYSANPGDISWSPLEAFGRVEVYDDTDPEQVVERAAQAEILIVNRVALSKETLRRLPRLRYIGTLATGYNTIDVKAAAQLGIPVCNVPDYCTGAVAQMTFALLLELVCHVKTHSDLVRAGCWSASKELCYRDIPLVGLEGKTMGILGYGAIGRAVGRIAMAMGMRVLCHSRTPQINNDGSQWVDFDTLLRQSDVLSLHCPLTEQTREIIGEAALSRLKPGAYLVNTARGLLLNEQAVANALNEGRLAGTALDVLAQEPPAPNNPLLTARNCLITPHIAWAPREARVRLVHIVAQNIAAFLRGAPQNNVAQEPTG